jgi:hypothetical protein
VSISFNSETALGCLYKKARAHNIVEDFNESSYASVSTLYVSGEEASFA